MHRSRERPSDVFCCAGQYITARGGPGRGNMVMKFKDDDFGDAMTRSWRIKAHADWLERRARAAKHAGNLRDAALYAAAALEAAEMAEAILIELRDGMEQTP